MDYYSPVDYISPPAADWVSVAPYEPEKHVRKSLVQQTLFSATVGIVDFFVDAKGQKAPTALGKDAVAPASHTALSSREAAAKSPTTSASNSVANTEVSEIARRRVQLMAANYASGNESAEIIARLEILNSRLLEKAPRITAAQVEALENATDQLMQIRSAREARAKRLGLSV